MAVLIVLTSRCQGGAPGDNRPEPQVITPDQATRATGTHLLVRRGARDLRHPAAVRAGDRLAVAYQERDLETDGLILGIGVAPADRSGPPWRLVFREVRRAAPEVTAIRPQLAPRSGGYWLAWTEHQGDGWITGEEGVVYRAALDFEGMVMDGPYEEPLAPCRDLRLAGAGESGTGMDVALLVCLAEPGPLSLQVVLAAQGSPASAPLIFEECNFWWAPVPAALWDGERFGVLYLCRPELGSSLVELRWARLRPDPEDPLPVVEVVDASDLGDDGRPIGLAATRDGSEVAVLWSWSQGIHAPISRFATLATSGEVITQPTTVSLAGQSLGYQSSLLQVEDGYLLWTGSSECTVEDIGGWGWACALDGHGEARGECLEAVQEARCTPPILVPIPYEGGTALLFEEVDFWWSTGKSSLYTVGWQAPGVLVGEAQPLDPPARDLWPQGLSCTEERCHALGTEAHSYSFEPYDARRATLISIEIEQSEAQVIPTPLHPVGLRSPNLQVAASRGSLDLGLLSEEVGSGGGQQLSVIGPGGEVRFTHDTSALLAGSVRLERLFKEGDELRLIFWDAEQEQTETVLFTGGWVGSALPVHGEPCEQLASAEGVFFALILDDSGGGHYHLLRFDPEGEDHFRQLQEERLTRRGTSLMAAPGLIGALEYDWLLGSTIYLDALLLKRWEPSGTPSTTCPLEGFQITGVEPTVLGDDLALILYDEHGSSPVHLVRIDARSPGRLYSLELPSGARGFHRPRSQGGTTSTFRALWQDSVTGAVTFSEWQTPGIEPELPPLE